MEHSFDIEIAKKYGIPSAILLKNFYFWTEKNKANERHFYDDLYWTYNSKKAFKDLFPYMTTRQIDYAINNLVENGILIKGCYNEKKMDRTLWYAITKLGYCILQNCQMEMTKLSNDDINNNNTTLNKQILQADNIYISILDYLNNQAGTKYRNVDSNFKWIKARLKDGYNEDDLKAVIDKKVKEWKGTEMQKYLRPETLFGSKFESYLNGLETVEEKSKDASGFMKHEYTEEQLKKAFLNWGDGE